MFCSSLGVTSVQADAARKAASTARSRSRASGDGGVSEPPRDAKEYWNVKEKMEEHVKNCCLLSAPTGCASFQLKFGASTLHRTFGVPVGYCGPWSKAQREGERFRKMKARLMQAQLFVMDEMSMIGRQMMGKIEFRIQDTLKGTMPCGSAPVYLGGRDAVLAGDPKQAPPLGDEPLCRLGEYKGKGQNKPRGVDRTPSNAWSTSRLVSNGMFVRDSFQDAVILRQVHRFEDENASVPSDRREEYKKDAQRFLAVTRGMADCSWKLDDHEWLSRRNRSRLQQTPEGREELRRFDTAPLLMDGRVTRATGEIGANRVNLHRLEELSARTGKPICVLKAYHDKPNDKRGQEMKPEECSPDDFRGMENELLLCEGARVLLTQNLWVEAGLMNGAIGELKGYMWPEGGDPHSPYPKKRSPLCVFVEFDSVDLGKDEAGRPRSFFPNDDTRRNWIPIFRQRVSSTVEDNLSRENYPLTLAWALTHWKAQGMTLDRVRVHLSERTAAVPGIGFVACTRVRHPWDIVFEEDLPDYGAFMKARKTLVFRERKRFELRQEAKASWTLRNYGFCEADIWTREEAAVASELLGGLTTAAAEQKQRLLGQGRRLDGDSYLWGAQEPDYVGQLACEVARVAGDGRFGRALCERVAERLLDRARVRVATSEEKVVAAQLLDGIDVVS